MTHGNPRDHHYVPQFYLRQFASDPERKKLRTVMRDGDYAIFAERAIKNLGYERDFYVHLRGSTPVNVEVAIGKYAEMMGLLRFQKAIWRGRQPQLIEHRG